MGDIREQLRNLRNEEGAVNPSLAWKQNTRNFLLREIQKQGETVQSVPATSFRDFWKLSFLVIPAPLRKVTQGALTIVLVMGITIGGWLTGVSASYNSLPGDMLYNVKLATEKTKVAVAKVTGDQGAEIQLNLDHATRRVQEMKQVATIPEYVTKAANEFQKSVGDVHTGLMSAQEKDPEQAVVLAKEVTEKINTLSDSLNAVVENPTIQNSEAAKDVADSEKAVKGAELQAIAVVATVHPEEGKVLVQQQVQKILDDNASARIDIESVVQNAAATSETSTSSVAGPLGLFPTSTFALSFISSTLSGVSSSEGIVTSASSSPSLPSVETSVKKMTESVAQVEAGVKEINSLMDENDLTKAVEKLKTLTDITTDTKHTLVEVQTQVKIEAAANVSSTQPIAH